MASKLDTLRAQLYQAMLEKHQHVERLKVLDTAITALISQVAVFEQQETEAAAAAKAEQNRPTPESTRQKQLRAVPSTAEGSDSKMDEKPTGGDPSHAA